MAQQKLKIREDNGSKAYRVMDLLTPLNGTAAPTVNAEFLGQLFIDTATPAIYMSVKVGDATPANDWKKLAFAV